MAAAYDQYDYPAYWLGRKYEHESEIIALSAFLAKIPKLRSILEIGAGFGRLTPFYAYRAQKVVLADPSAKLLKEARNKGENLEFIQSCLENLPEKLKRKRFDLIILVRVAHHLEDMDKTLAIINKLLSPKGYFVLEFPNKLHGKAMLANFCHGNFTFPLDIFPFDKRTKKAKKARVLPFFNYHPTIIEEKLTNQGFKILEKRSVSNIRNKFFKKNLPISFLLSAEKIMQKPFSSFNFGPSIFIFAQKGDA